MANTKLVTNYATALYKVAKQIDQEEEIYEQVKAIAVAINKNLGTKSAFCSPIISRLDKEKILKLIIKKFALSTVLERFFSTLVRNSRMTILPEIAEAYHNLILEEKSTKIVKIISAKELDKNDQSELHRLLEVEFKSKLTFDLKIDKSIIAGLIIRYDSNVIDASVIGTLRKIGQKAKSLSLSYNL